MPRAINPLSKRNKSRKFTAEEILDAIAKRGDTVGNTVELAASKRAKKVREADEFDLARLVARATKPYQSQPAASWSIEQIAMARDAQLRGRFALASKLAIAMRTDDAISVARRIRLDSPQSLSTKLIPPNASSPRVGAIMREADALFGPRGISCPADVLSDIRSEQVDHGVAFGVVDWIPRVNEKGYYDRVDPYLSHWPIEFVYWNEAINKFQTQTLTGIETIEHGQGRWIVFAKNRTMPFREDAAIVPAAMVWARHAFAMKDWSRGSASHGNAKVVGELPEGIRVQDADAQLTDEAEAFLELLMAIASIEAPVGIKPSGSTIDYLVNSSRAWEVWAQLAANAERAAARIYLGTDGVLGAVGGAPGVDISALFGVGTTKIQGDLACECAAIDTGLIEPWCALNHGDSSLAPSREYEFPDADLEKRTDSYAKRNAAFLRDLASYRANGFLVSQELVEQLAAEYNVLVPQLPATTETPRASIALAPTDIAKVVRVAEARVSQGLPPLADERDMLMISELGLPKPEEPAA